METTFILASHFGVTPFEIMAQDLDEVILVINYFLSRNEKSENHSTNNTINEKEQAAEFWACL